MVQFLLDFCGFPQEKKGYYDSALWFFLRAMDSFLSISYSFLMDNMWSTDSCLVIGKNRNTQ